MNNREKFYESGDFHLEFKGKYLGCAQININLTPATLERRRDGWLPPLSKQVKSVHLQVSAVLQNADIFWDLIAGEQLELDDFADKLFESGAVLRLFPVDKRRRGYEFEKAYITAARHTSGQRGQGDSLKLDFVSEFDKLEKCFFKRIEAGTLPAAVPARKTPDIKNISRNLINLLAEKLGAIPDRTMCMDFFGNNEKGSFALKLKKCSVWANNAPHILHYTLTARFLPEYRDAADAGLMACANFLHGNDLEIPDCTVLTCSVESLEFSNSRNSNGVAIGNSVMEFTLQVF